MKRKIKWFLFVLAVDIILAIICLLSLKQYHTGMRSWLSKAAAGSGAEAGAEVEDEAGGRKYLALTFDDGPHPEYTKKLLDGLKARDVKASFFLIGKNINGNEELVRQMTEDGHLIGTHCYSHEDLTKVTLEKACEDILKTNRLIEDITGQSPEYIRPPFGIWSPELGDCVDMTAVFWDIDTLDWKNQDSSAVLKHIEKKAGKHQVILLHDVFETSVDAALAAIDTLAKQGYTFVTIDELLID